MSYAEYEKHALKQGGLRSILQRWIAMVMGSSTIAEAAAHVAKTVNPPCSPKNEPRPKRKFPILMKRIFRILILLLVTVELTSVLHRLQVRS